MTDTEKPVPPAAEPQLIRTPRRSSAGWLWLLLAALLAVGGWAGYQWWLHAQGEALRRQETAARLTQEIAALQAQMREQRQQQLDLSGSVTELSQRLEGGRERVQLAAIEQLLLLANDRLLLARDVAGARRALATADERLAALKDPRLLPVREALAQEQAALAALPSADTTGAALALGQLMRDAPRFALRTRVPERFVPASADSAAPPPDAPAAQRVWSAVKTALAAIFTLRRSEGPALRLLAPEEETLAARILQLKLEGARIALLSGDSATLRDLTRAAADWLRAYYNDGDPAVRAALDELARLSALELNPPPPDISRSLALLREQAADFSR